ncbi:MAG: histidinol-phosphate transaminase [Ignavibacteriae bacterium]|nr:histidinol-phosphate transaminase [Ignavibacteria bacterium]MBI3365648.1 histidinol-phosphate transaminase [Ignavibacteriota bacterium]
MIDQLIRPHFKGFKPYRSARSETQAAKIFLDANELSLGSPVSVDGVSLNRYPDPSQTSLREVFACRHGVSPERIFCGVGSDEIIDLLIRLLCEPGKDEVLILEPTYGVYRVQADVNAVHVSSIQLDAKFQIDVGKTLEAITSDTKMLFCCSPNNPTGNLLRTNDILELSSHVRGIVVVDEAYIDFAESSDQLVSLVERFENLAVLRTLSKAWGLAGIRLGYCVAHPELVSYLLRIKAPYSVNAVTSMLALSALRNEKFFAASVETVKRERARMAEALRNVESVREVYPSDANFLLVDFLDAGKAFDALIKQGIVVRRRSEPRLRSCLRITIGTPEENGFVLRTLARMK